jgi:uncharacterized protein DUF6717
MTTSIRMAAAAALLTFAIPASTAVNALNVISPYRHNGMWVFDDPRVGLDHEPFIAGADTMIDKAVAKVPNAQKGFLMVFSETPFPGHQIMLEWKRAEGGGDWYYSPQLQQEGWLCPALLKYFAKPPKNIFVQVRPKTA